MGQISVYFRNYARRIDRLPILNVDPRYWSVSGAGSRPPSARVRSRSPKRQGRSRSADGSLSGQCHEHGHAVGRGFWGGAVGGGGMQVAAAGFQGWGGFVRALPTRPPAAQALVRTQERQRGTMSANLILQAIDNAAADMRVADDTEIQRGVLKQSLGTAIQLLGAARRRVRWTAPKPSGARSPWISCTSSNQSTALSGGPGLGVPSRSNRSADFPSWIPAARCCVETFYWASCAFGNLHQERGPRRLREALVAELGSVGGLIRSNPDDARLPSDQERLPVLLAQVLASKGDLAGARAHADQHCRSPRSDWVLSPPICTGSGNWTRSWFSRRRIDLAEGNQAPRSPTDPGDLR